MTTTALVHNSIPTLASMGDIDGKGPVIRALESTKITMNQIRAMQIKDYLKNAFDDFKNRKLAFSRNRADLIVAGCSEHDFNHSGMVDEIKEQFRRTGRIAGFTIDERADPSKVLCPPPISIPEVEELTRGVEVSGLNDEEVLRMVILAICCAYAYYQGAKGDDLASEKTISQQRFLSGEVSNEVGTYSLALSGLQSSSSISLSEMGPNASSFAGKRAMLGKMLSVVCLAYIQGDQEWFAKTGAEPEMQKVMEALNLNKMPDLSEKCQTLQNSLADPKRIDNYPAIRNNASLSALKGVIGTTDCKIHNVPLDQQESFRRCVLHSASLLSGGGSTEPKTQRKYAVDIIKHRTTHMSIWHDILDNANATRNMKPDIRSLMKNAFPKKKLPGSVSGASMNFSL